ncbi:hypothetical protein [Arthrobacter sp. NA-172]|uniref:hypothetical protein n=1 Tax=Arthrobacter sp. NA-172 TaxID=3367524 RepID=UPI003754A6EB
MNGLLGLIDEHQEPLEYDLIALGLRLRWLGTERLAWGDLLAIVRQSPRGSALSRAMNGEADMWGLSEHLLAAAVDVLAAGNWQRAGDERAKRPELLPRPGVNKRGLDGEQIAGGKAVSIEEMNKKLGWPQP